MNRRKVILYGTFLVLASLTNAGYATCTSVCDTTTVVLVTKNATACVSQERSHECGVH